MKRILTILLAWALILGAPVSFGQVTTDATKTRVPVGTAIGSGTFAQMKTLTCSSSVNDGASYLVTNYGRGGSVWRCAGSLGDWFPIAPLKVYENTAIVSGVVQAAAQILLAIPVEAGLLSGKTFRVLVTWAKSGGTDTLTPTIRMGNTGTTADATLVTQSTLTGANRSLGTEVWHRMASVTSAERLGGVTSASFGASSTTGVAFGATVVATVASANFIALACTMSGTTDTPQVGYVTVEIQP